MKSNPLSPWINRALTALVSLTFAAAGHAADFTWDADPTGVAGAQDGGGNWDNTTNSWISGGVNALFPAAPAVINKTGISSNIVGATTLTMTSTAGLINGQEISFAAFPVGTTITVVDATTISLSQPASAVGSGGAANFQLPLNNATFGSASGNAGTVTLTAAQSVKNLTINAAGSGNYTFAGSGATGTLTVGSIRENTTVTVNSSATFNNIVNVNSGGANARIVFGTGGQTLTFTGGGSILSSAGASSGITATSDAIRNTSTVLVTAGAYTGNTGVWNIGDSIAGTGGVRVSGATTTVGLGSLQVGREGGNGGYATFNSGATLSVPGQVSIGRTINNKGTLNLNGATFTNNYNNTAEASMMIGREGGIGKLEVTGNSTVTSIGTGITANTGGVVVINSQSSNANSLGTLDIISGTVTIKDLRLNGTNTHVAQAALVSSAGKAVLNLGAAGSLYLGGTVTDTSTPGVAGGSIGNIAGGLSNRGTGTSTYEVNLNGGTLGSNALWTSSVAMKLGTGTNTTFKAANASNVANDMTFTGQLTGDGAWTKTGGGTLTLNSSTALNNFTGGSTISAGTVVAAAQNSFGTGSVSLANLATLTLQNNATIADTATLMFGASSIINLDFSGAADTVGAITNTSSGTSAAPGTYTAAQLNFLFGVTSFNGTGSLTVLIPEPASSTLLGLAAAALAFNRRRVPRSA